ncbi:MAG: ABC transporter ATP-binding protein, partial [Clostridiales bacterium]|nr:ABC transporter ATP-binding protein [Clostridiales bacterium]
VMLGPSGSGKTTLLNVLGGLDKVHNGAIEFGEKVINRYSSRIWDEIRNKDVGYIFQNYNLLTNLTVYDNIALTLNMVGVVDKGEIDRRIDYILENIGMINYRKRRAYQLSGGQQQRVAIARAIVKKPKLLIADEPTGNLDSRTTARIIELMIAMQKKFSMTLILVTHNMDLARRMDSCLQITDGRISVVSA